MKLNQYYGMLMLLRKQIYEKSRKGNAIVRLVYIWLHHITSRCTYMITDWGANTTWSTADRSRSYTLSSRFSEITGTVCFSSSTILGRS